MMSVKSVKQQVIQGKIRLSKKIKDKVLRIHAAMMEELLEATRVDSGVLRANWIPSINSPSDEFYSYGVQIGDLSDYPRGEQVGFDQAFLVATDLSNLKFKIGDTILNTNSTPYTDNFDFEADMKAAYPLMRMAAEREASKK